MTTSERQQGSQAPGLVPANLDGRVTDLVVEHALLNPFLRQATQLLADPLQAIQPGLSNPVPPPTWGFIVQAFPHLHCYKVQLGDNAGTMICSLLGVDGSLPLGPRRVGVLPPHTRVLVQRWPGIPLGSILGAAPAELRDARIHRPGWLYQGGQAGLWREAAHYTPLTLYKNGGLRHFGAGAPLDETLLDWGILTETGVGLNIDPLVAFLRASEVCGLWVHYRDDFLRLAGRNMDVFRMTDQERSRHDEGELTSVRKHFLYPWEALGFATPSGTLGAAFAEQDAQRRQPVGAVDLSPETRAVEGLARRIEYGGYLGQGGLRDVLLPAQQQQPRRRDGTDVDEGLFREAIGIDGDYLVQSAKGITLVKRCMIASPRERVLPEDARGDDKAANNYKFSGQFGTSPDHKVGDVPATGARPDVQRLAALADLLAYACNWKAVHPFHYHQGDYRLPQESASPHFTRVQDALDFGALAGQADMAVPTPVPLRIDHRYGTVDYYQRLAYFTLRDDGAVALGCGWGGQLTFRGGHILFDNPGDVIFAPGRRFLVMGSEIVLKAHDSIDISSSNRDLRLYAHKNMQLGAGNVLIDAQNEADTYDYRNLIGEDVQSTGIILKAKTGIVHLADNIYLRSAAGTAGSGDVVVDAGRKQDRFIVKASDSLFFVSQAVSVWTGPTEGNATQLHRLSADQAAFSTQVIVGGSLLLADAGSNLLVRGSVAAGKNIACAGKMADRSGGMLGKVPDEFSGKIDEAGAQAASSLQQAIQDGGQAETTLFDTRWYATGRPAGDQALADIGFSYRDDNAQRQYRVTGLRLVESRWQTLARLGGGSGGSLWTEQPVTYQGQELYPWPGRRKWAEEAVVDRLDGGTLFDYAQGRSVDRPGPYEDPTLGTLTPATLATSFRIIPPS